MLSEIFITSVLAEQRSANTAISKDVGIYVHTLHPTHSIKSTFKKSSTHPNCIAVSSTHIFAAQADKAVLHVYSRDRGNHEALISFPERIHCLTLVNDGLLVVGTAEGRIILWEVCTGRQISTLAAHLQAITCIAASSQHIITGSEDSNIHIWSVASLVSLTSKDVHQQIRTLSNHRAAITAIAVGHGSSDLNICVSASKDNSCVAWNYHTGELLRTFLLPTSPLCLTIDPCDRAFYVGFQDGSVESIELFQPTAVVNTLYDTNLQATPIQIVPNSLSGAPSDTGAVCCLGLSYDGTVLLSGHATGKIIRWDVGPRRYSAELADLNAPVTNLTFLSPFPSLIPVRAVTVVKPRFGEGNYTFVGQFTSSMGSSEFEAALRSPGLPQNMLETAILEFSRPVTTSSAADEQLRKENEELWAVVNEQRALQKRTYEKYIEAKAAR